jgi:hypothetical protein
MFVFNRGQAEAFQRRHEASNSAAFFTQFIDTMSLGREGPVYKLLHIGVPHRPVVLDAECEFIGRTRFSLQAYLGQSRCAVNLVTAFLDRLRDYGIYDTSLIVVSSDHGTDLRPPGYEGRSGSLPELTGASTSGLPSIVGASRPLMAIKPVGRTGTLVVSDAPTTHADLPATMLNLLDLPADLGHHHMLEQDSTSSRERFYGAYDLRFRFPETHLNRLDVLSVRGKSVDATGWNLVRSVMPPDLRLEPGDIDFGDGRNTAYLGPGWSRATQESAGEKEATSFVFGISRQAVIFVSLPPDPVELVARMASPEDGQLNTVEVAVDGEQVAQWSPQGRTAYQDYSTLIPADPARPPISQITLTFESPTVVDAHVKLEGFSVRAR